MFSGLTLEDKLSRVLDDDFRLRESIDEEGDGISTLTRSVLTLKL